MIRRTVLCVGLVLIATACNWRMSNYGPERSGFNAFANNISVANVASLQQEWTASNVSGSAIVANGKLYVGSYDSPFTLQAFDAAGKNGCPGSPTVCTPLWTGETLGSVSDQVFDNNRVYAVTGADWLYVFNANGERGCSGTPIECDAAWRAAGVTGEPVVVGKFLYALGNDGRLRAYDAFGTEHCSGSPKLCTPLWTAADGGRISVANGLVYVAKLGQGLEVRAFDAAGQHLCSGSPRTCAPLWTARAPLAGGISGDAAAPMIADGFLYPGGRIGDESFTDGQTYVFDAVGTNGCSGTPKTCAPLWEIPTDAVASPPASAYDTLYVIDHFFDQFAGVARNTLRAFDAGACTSDPPGCTPLFTAPGVVGAPSVANGLAYVGTGGRLSAFDATGATGCTGSPKVCTPLWTATVGAFVSEPVIASGMVYVLDLATPEGNVLRAFGLP